jgi:peptidyl-tRNA hydrolase
LRFLRRGEQASTLDLLVVGLGNPGREHARDRHNVGWMVVDALAERHGGSFRSKFSGRLAEVRDGDLRLGLLKPETYMNLSGQSLAAAARFFKVAPESIAVVHDRRPVADYVLSPFAPEDDGEALVGRAADAVEALAHDGLDEAQRRFN